MSRFCTELLRGADTRAQLGVALAELDGLLERLDALDVSR